MPLQAVPFAGPQAILKRPSLGTPDAAPRADGSFVSSIVSATSNWPTPQRAPDRPASGNHAFASRLPAFRSECVLQEFAYRVKTSS